MSARRQFRYGRIARYGLALLLPVAALLLRLALVGTVGELPHYITFYPAVMLAALVGGLGPGLVTTGVAAVFADYWILKPHGFGIDTLADAVGLALFLVMGVFMSGVAEQYRRARQRAATYAQELGVQEGLARGAAEIERQRQLLAVTLASIGDGVIVTDLQGRITSMNGEAERLTGWTGAEALGQPLTAVFHVVNEQTRAPIESPVDRVLRRGGVVGLGNHSLLIAKAGRETPIDDSGAPIRQADGSVHGVVLVFRDVTERRHAEEALRRASEEWEETFNTVPDLLAILDDKHRVVRANRALASRLGRSPEECVGLRCYEVVHGTSSPPGSCPHVQTCRDGLEHVTEVHEPHLGGDFLVSTTPRFDGNGHVVGSVHVARDITERKRAEVALRESEARQKVAEAVRAERQRLHDILEMLPAYLVLLSPDYHVPFANRFFRERFGEADGQRCYEYLFGRTEPCATCETFTVLKTKQPHHWEWTGPDGRNYDIFDFPFTDADGSPLIMEMGIDVTERKKAEQALKEANETLEQRVVERTEALRAAKISAERAKAAAEEATRAKDHFLAVLSHELRTPLTPVLATASLLDRDPRLDDTLRESIAVIRRNAELEARLIDDLLDLTRIARGKVELDRRPVELGTIITRAIEVCRPDIAARQLQFTVGLRGGTQIVDGDAKRLQQVFWNLLSNAIKFTPQGGRVGIRCWPEADQVVAEISDSGIGIEPAALSRIFNAFEQAERTARRFGGLGLGLAISKTLIELHGGTIAAASAGEGQGATFTVRLPLAVVPTPQMRPEAVSLRERAAEAEPHRRLRILLVEDHGDTARVITQLLQRAGHEVSTVGDMAAALREADQREFDLLVSDLGLPDGSGLELMREFRRRGRTYPGIALTGFGQQADVARSLAAGFASHLTKPVDQDQLERAIAEVCPR